MSLEENKAVVRRIFEEMNKENWAGIEELCAPHYVCVFGGMGHAPLAMMLIVGEITGRYALACRDSGGRVKRVEARSWVIIHLSHQKCDS
jgi:hypothetical protein